MSVVLTKKVVFRCNMVNEVILKGAKLAFLIRNTQEHSEEALNWLLYSYN